MLRFLRISALLYVLAFVAAAAWVTTREATDWDIPLRVHVYALPGDPSAAVAERVRAMRAEDFARITRFFAAEAKRYGVALEEPFSFFVPTPASVVLPPLPLPGSHLGTVLWSLKMRWLAARLRWRADDPLVPDITLFLVFHDGRDGTVLDRSTALRKGLIAIANVFAEPASQGPNDVVIAHELLHTLGATDKYAWADNLPHYPDGYAEPAAVPRYPQAHAEIMGGRRPIDAKTAEIPEGLQRVVVGRLTATEIGWLDPGDY